MVNLDLKKTKSIWRGGTWKGGVLNNASWEADTPKPLDISEEEKNNEEKENQKKKMISKLKPLLSKFLKEFYPEVKPKNYLSVTELIVNDMIERGLENTKLTNFEQITDYIDSYIPLDSILDSF